MVLAHAFDLHAAIVQIKSVRLPFRLADAEDRVLPVGRLPVDFHRGAQHVKRGRKHVPKARRAERELHRHGFFAARGNVRLRRRARGERLALLAFQREHFLRDFDARRLFPGVGDGRVDGNSRARRLVFLLRAAVVDAPNALDFGNGHEHAPMRDVDGIRFRDPDVAVNARARIPARRVRLVFRAHGDDVVPAEIQKRRDVDAKRVVAVFPFAGELPVHVDLRHHHHAVEIEKKAVALRGGVDLEILAVPADGRPRERARLVRLARQKTAFHAPVVRQVELAPLPVGVARRGRGGAGVVRREAVFVFPELREAPAVVESFALRILHGSGGERSREKTRRSEDQG